MKKLPIGKQHLELFVKQNLLYVDKTELIYQLVEDGNYYLLSRPRRFGKSLLVDTDQKYFLSYQNNPKEVLLLGIAFNQEKRQVVPIEWEKVSDE